MRVTALILAAGFGRRMGGQLKQTIDIDGVPMLEKVIQTTMAHNFAEVITIIGHEAEKIQQKIKVSDPCFRWVYNENYGQGQGSSLLKGISECKTDHVMIFLGDMPFIQSQTIDLVLHEGCNQSRNGAYAIRPIYEGKPGHPVFIGNINKVNFTSLEGDSGAKQLMSQLQVNRIRVSDHGVAQDIDTIEMYERFR